MHFYIMRQINFHKILQLLYVAVIIFSCIPICVSEIKNTRITDDVRFMLFFEKFGFEKGGRIDISLKNVSWKPQYDYQTQPIDPSTLGFFLAKEATNQRIFAELFGDNEICMDTSRMTQLIFNFTTLASGSNYNHSIVIVEPHEYTLVFARCPVSHSKLSMQVHTEIYNLQNGKKDFLPAGQTQLPLLYFVFFLIYASFFAAWVFICSKQRPTVKKIHLIMGALLILKALKMLCASEDKMYIGKTGTPHGWDIAFYIFGFFKGVMLFTVIILIGTGWSFLKPYLQEREKKILMTVIPLQALGNIAYVVIDENGPAMEDWVEWNQVLFVIDIICCCAVFFPIIWSIKGLREASKTDGKAAKNLEKLTLFKQFYIVVVGYIYFTRVLVWAIGAVVDYRNEWVTSAASEGVILAFFAFIFHNFQPIEKNPYLEIDEEEEAAASQMLEEADSFEL